VSLDEINTECQYKAEIGGNMPDNELPSVHPGEILLEEFIDRWGLLSIVSPKT
jgi:hypothetical protein